MQPQKRPIWTEIDEKKLIISVQQYTDLYEQALKTYRDVIRKAQRGRQSAFKFTIHATLMQNWMSQSSLLKLPSQQGCNKAHTK